MLNTLLEWNADGIHYEADQRHAQIIMQTLGLEHDFKGSAVPGLREEVDLEHTSPLLSSQQTSLYRAIAARAMYLSQDRTDICFSAKELSRHMSAPTELSWPKLKRFGRYLSNHIRYLTYLSIKTTWTDY